MKPITKRMLSLLMTVILVLGLPSTAMAATDMGSSTETVAAVTEPEETTEPTTEETEAVDPTEPTEPTEADDTDSEEQEVLIITPDPIMEDNPYDPDWPYPYGLPVDNQFPADLLDVDPYAVSLMADMSLIPDEMYDNYILRALEYTGYDVQYLKDNGYLYVAQYCSANISTYAPDVLSDIGYDDYSPYLNGDETVADSSTVTGLAPDIALFEANGLVCASFVSYYWNNYLPNIEGIDTTWISDAIKATTMNNGSYSTASVWSWETGLTNLANTAGSGVTRYTDEDTAYANLVPGDIIIFSNSDGDLTHAAIYAGAYTMYNASGTNRGTYHYIIHVGNSRGPEISAVEYMVSSGSKSSSPSAWYHIELPEVDAPGWIEVYKKDPNGAALSGAYFTAVDQSTGDKYVIGPTNSSGYAKSGELPLGTYVVTETVFPANYEASGTTTWTLTLTKDTPDMTLTINAVNKLKTGYIEVYKEDEDGNALAGAVFTAVNQSTNVSYTIGPCDSDGYAKSEAVPFGTYVITESVFPDGFTASGTTSWTLTIDDNTTNRTVTVNAVNKRVTGSLTVRKATTTGNGVELGWVVKLWRVEDDGTWTYIGSGTTKQDKDDPTYTFTDLTPGRYVVQEDSSVSHPGYSLDVVAHEVEVVAGSTATVTITNTEYGQGKLIKSMPDGGSVAGWVFDMYRGSDDAFIGTYTSGEDGTILTDYVEPGEYRILERIPEGSLYYCETENPQTITIEAGGVAEVTFTNRLKPAEIAAYKVDVLGAPLSGAEFLLEWSADDGATWQPVTYTDSQYVEEGTCTSAGLVDGKLESGKDGMVRFTGLHPGLLYRLTETKAPDGYQLLTEPAYVGGISAENNLIVELTVVNALVYELPMTGSTGSTIQNGLQLVGACMLLALLLYVAKTKKRR